MCGSFSMCRSSGFSSSGIIPFVLKASVLRDVTQHIVLLFISLDFSTQIMCHLDKVHMILDEMIMNGDIVEPRKKNVLAMMKVIDGKT